MNDYEKEYEKVEQFLAGHGLMLDIRANGTAIDPFREGKGQWFHKYLCTLSGSGGRWEFPFYTGMGWTHDPRPGDVLHFIQGDCFAGAMTLADFISDFGYDEVTDRKRASKVWNACKANRQGIAAAMGAEVFQAFLSLEIEL